MKIERNKIVTIQYTLTDTEGNVLDKSEEGAPFAYLHGANLIIPGLEKELEGKSSGENLEVHLQSKDAYGEWDESMVHRIPRDQFEVQGEIAVGMQFEADQDNTGLVFTVIDMDEDHIVVDGNHILAGVDLIFSVEILDVREATRDELEALENPCDCGGADHSACGAGHSECGNGDKSGCCGGGGHRGHCH